MAKEALGRENVLAVAMPCNSKKEDLEDAKLLVDTLDIKMIEINLDSTFEELENSINEKLYEIKNDKISEEAKINIKPRLRMTTLYSIAQSLDYLVIGTSNLCEIMVRVYNKMGR